MQACMALEGSQITDHRSQITDCGLRIADLAWMVLHGVLDIILDLDIRVNIRDL
jgi:hypothetical protein